VAVLVNAKTKVIAARRLRLHVIRILELLPRGEKS
jgi:hypothetical protein